MSPLLSRFSEALTVTIDPTTFVAELLPAPASHTVAAHGPLDPEVALRALLEFLTLSVSDKLFIVFTQNMIALILFTRDALMVSHTA